MAAVERERNFSAPDSGLVNRGERPGVIHGGAATWGVLMQGRRDGIYYLNEAGDIARRDRKRPTKKAVLMAIAILLIVFEIAQTVNITRQ